MVSHFSSEFIKGFVALELQRSTEQIEKIIMIGKKELSNKTLDTTQNGGYLLTLLCRIERYANVHTKSVNDLFHILCASGADHQINYNSDGTSYGTSDSTPLISSIVHNASITFSLLMRCPSIDLNMTAYSSKWTPLIIAIHYKRNNMVAALCERFYEIDFNMAIPNLRDRDKPLTALTMVSNYGPDNSGHPIRVLIETAVNINLPNYKKTVNDLLLNHFPKVLISLIELYAFF